MTQEDLAEAARLSPRSISDLERGINRTAQKNTALLLADALGLAEPVRALFVAAARGRGPAAALRASPLVTVTGPGGVGKTRLALRAAADQLPSFGEGAWLCELAAAPDAETMAQVVAAALRVRPRPDLSTAGSVVEFLRTRTALLLVLDNCEHLLAAAAVLAAGKSGCSISTLRTTRHSPSRPDPNWPDRRSWSGSPGSGPSATTCRRPSPGRWPAAARRARWPSGQSLPWPPRSPARPAASAAWAKPALPTSASARPSCWGWSPL